MWFYDEMDSFGAAEFRKFQDVAWLIALKTMEVQALIRYFVPVTGVE